MTPVAAASGPRISEFSPPTLTIFPCAIEQNIAITRKRTSALLMAVVKADGYGHGTRTVARAAVISGVEWLGTTDLEDALDLRDAGLTVPILTWLNPAGFDPGLAAAARIDIAVGSTGELEALCAGRASQVRVHLNLDTGMAREGCSPAEWGTLVRQACAAQQRGLVRVVGLMGHLPLADQARPEANSVAVARIHQAREIVVAHGLGLPLTHLAATSGLLTDPATHFDLVRLGAGLVGIDPSGTTDLVGASRLTAPVVHSAQVQAGTPVGYGGHHTTKAATTLAVLPVGYADGIPRELSPDAWVAIRGRPCPVVGRVSMDQIVVDTGTDVVPRGTTATLFAPGGGDAPTIHHWAHWAGTIPHTIVTGIGPRVRKAIA